MRIAKKFPAYWYRSGNFGDELTPFLIEKMTGEKPVYVSPTDGVDHVCMIGSILDAAGANTVVWGAGFVNWGEYSPPAPKEVLAVRGSLSALKYSGMMDISQMPLGDPALLLPRFYNPEVKKKYRLGIVPHVADLMSVALRYGGSHSEVSVIHLGQPPEKVIQEILSCETIISSSLHGLVVAHAYGMPARWAEFSNSVLGNGFKFADYGTTVEFEKVPLDFRSYPSIRSILDTPIESAVITTDLDKLLSSCPLLES